MNHVIRLPQLECAFPGPAPERQVLLAAGGRAPQPAWLKAAAAGRAVWCVDHGIDCCQSSRIIPERVIGDGDSASSSGWDWGRQLGVPTEVHPAEKNLTDLQLALQRAGTVYDQAAILVTGVWGGRFDHAFSNVFSLTGCAAWGISRCLAADQSEVLVLLQGKDSVRLTWREAPEVISLLPLAGVCNGVSIQGVHWPLDRVELLSTLPYAVSNRPAAETVSVALTSGSLGVYLCWQSAHLTAGG